MRIIIVQAEIEEAIRNYIQKQVKIETGMRIDMELAATRGDDGFTAEIFIVPDVPDQPDLGIATKIAEAKAAPAAEEKGTVARKPRRTNAQIAADNAAAAAAAAGEAQLEVEQPTEDPAEQAEEAAEEVEQLEAVAEAEVVEEALEEAQEALPVAEAAVDVETEGEPAAEVPVRKSLFGGLTHPKG